MANDEIAAGRPGFRPVHPGRVLRNSVLPDLEKRGVTVVAFAAHLGLSRQTVYQIANEARPVTADVAARLAAALGNSASFWLNMQANHDAWEAERSHDIWRIKRLNLAPL